MQPVLSLAQTTIGKKAVMAVSGVVLFGYLIGHLAGNLKLYSGPESINAYAAWLREFPQLLWSTRALLLVAFVAHVASAVSLASRNVSARPVPYRMRRDMKTNYAARTMYWSGPILLLFVVYHLAHLTFLYGPYPMEHGNVYDNVVYGFRVWYISAIYIVAQLAVGLHVYHGVWAMFGSVGATPAGFEKLRRGIAFAFAAGITLGNLSFPITVMLGIVQPSGG